MPYILLDDVNGNVITTSNDSTYSGDEEAKRLIETGAYDSILLCDVQYRYRKVSKSVKEYSPKFPEEAGVVDAEMPVPDSYIKPPEIEPVIDSGDHPAEMEPL